MQKTGWVKEGVGNEDVGKLARTVIFEGLAVMTKMTGFYFSFLKTNNKKMEIAVKMELSQLPVFLLVLAL